MDTTEDSEPTLEEAASPPHLTMLQQNITKLLAVALPSLEFLVCTMFPDGVGALYAPFERLSPERKPPSHRGVEPARRLLFRRRRLVRMLRTAFHSSADRDGSAQETII